MLLTLLVLQVLITQVLNQTHQEVVAQLHERAYPVPVLSQAALQQAITHATEIKLVSATSERQFYSAEFNHCEGQTCYRMEHIFSVRSAILKEDIRFHAKRLK